jgi:ssDNA-binding Zn-finger/Zn-ribbon topoisomerase 1
MSTPHPFVLGRCSRCGDDLALYHSHGDKRRPQHFLGCLSYPSCTYTTAYEPLVHDTLAALGARLGWLEAQYAWLLCEVEALRAQHEEGA